MIQTPCPTTKTAVRRAIEAARAAKIDIARVDVDAASKVVVGKPDDESKTDKSYWSRNVLTHR
jgi:hypothetical protein